MKTAPIAATASQVVSEDTVIEAAAAPLALHLIPSVHQTGQKYPQNPVQLATAMRSLVVDRSHPIALEVAGTDQQRRLLIRARTQEDLTHVETQLHARLPNATFVPLAGVADPLYLRPGEALSVIELQPGRAPYLPLQEFEHLSNGEDPMLGLLAAVDALPSDLRAIAQLALVPASPTWSQSYQRKAIEHALEPERQKDRAQSAAARTSAGAPGTLSLILGALVLGGILFFQHSPQRLPSWLTVALQRFLHGEWQSLVGCVSGILVVMLVVLLVLRYLWWRIFQGPLYDMRSVAEKTSRPAYQVRLRLYVIGPAVAFPAAQKYERYPWSLLLSAGQMSLHAWLAQIRTHQWKGAVSALRIFVHATKKSLWYNMKRNSGTLGQNGRRLWWYWQRVRQERTRRVQILARMLSAYRQYHLASGNYFIPRSVSARRARAWVRKGTWWRGVHRSKHLIDVEALAALWHIPTDEVLPDLAQIDYRRSRSLFLPPGLHEAQNEMPIAVSAHAGHHVPFGLPAECLRSHWLIGGKSGEGKSTFMQHLAVRSMTEHQGLILVDPHGDLVEQVLRLVPPERCDDVVLIDLSDERFACGLNPIDATVARGRDKAISDLIKVLSRLWTTWGSRMEIAFEYALRTLYEANKILCAQGKAGQQYTLLDVMTLLTDESFCHSLLEQITDPFILRWWAKYYDPLSLQMQRDRVDPVLSKTAKFEGTIARHIVGQSLCSVNFPEYIQQEKIVLVKLAKGLVGEDVARILGATVLGFLQIALEEQGGMEGSQRKRFPILIDEFQTLEGVDWGALAELRKYGATFCLATQSLDYLREKQILPIVLANVKQFAIFRMSADDARLLHRELDVDPEDIVHLDTLTCYLKVIYQRHQQPTFSCTLRFPLEGPTEQVELIRSRCQQRYMRPVSAIDVELFERLARELAAAPGGADKKQQDIQGEPGMPQGRARQEGGNRGRKSQEKRPGPKRAPHPDVPLTTSGEITPMNWEETVGPLDSEEEEEEVDPGDRTA